MLVFLFNFSHTLSIYKTGGATGIPLSDEKRSPRRSVRFDWNCERFTNLFERYMKYLFLESTIALICCSCKVSHKPNERLKKEPFEVSEFVLNTLHLLNCKKLVVKFFVRNTSTSGIWCFRHQFRIYTFSKIRLCL